MLNDPKTEYSWYVPLLPFLVTVFTIHNVSPLLSEVCRVVTYFVTFVLQFLYSLVLSLDVEAERGGVIEEGGSKD